MPAMRCTEADRLLELFLDEELSPQKAIQVKGHLDACATCRAHAGYRAAIRNPLRELETETAPPDLWKRIFAPARGHQAYAGRRPQWLRHSVWLGLLPLGAALMSLPSRPVARLPGAEIAEAATAETDLGTALGESSTAVNVRTRIGQPAPRFTLRDADGRRHAVTPGGGRKHVIIFHMG